jgi:hypothetical protein
MNGRGRYVYKTGAVYIGDWLMNRKDGRGTLAEADGCCPLSRSMSCLPPWPTDASGVQICVQGRLSCRPSPRGGNADLHFGACILRGVGVRS